MMETMDAVELEKQKHNNTRMEALARLAKLEVLQICLGYICILHCFCLFALSGTKLFLLFWSLVMLLLMVILWNLIINECYSLLNDFCFFEVQLCCYRWLICGNWLSMNVTDYKCWSCQIPCFRTEETWSGGMTYFWSDSCQIPCFRTNIIGF